MRHNTRVCLLILGCFFSSIFVLITCKKLEGYKFTVYSTKFCPRNESEWNKRSSALNCNKTNGYTCLPNENLTELIEFCYTAPFIWIQEGVCLYLKRKGSYLIAYNCSSFIDGCHNTSYQSREIFKYPACITIGNGCFLAEQSCKSSSNATSGIDKDDWVWVLIVISIVVVVCFSSFMLYVYGKRKFSSCKRGNDIKNTSIELEELNVLIADTEYVKNDISTEPYKCIASNSLDDFEEKVSFTANVGTDKKDFSYEASPIWKQDDCFFISTKACKEVEKNIESKNLVIVTGHSGSGKSAIIQHIALKYGVQGWVVKRVKKVEDILDIYLSSRFQKCKIICVFNDPFGHESFDDLLSNSWQTYEEDIKLYLQTAKLIMSCRNHIISDTRLTRYLINQSHIVDIDNTKNKLSVDEKRQILTKYTLDMNLSDIECATIVEVERYFPLLCKLYSSNEDYKIKGIRFFTEPITVLKEEILGFRNKDKGKYCALALLVLFNDDLCVSVLLENKDTENKFKHTLKLCGLPEYTPPAAIGDNFNSLNGFFVKKIGDTYHFYHDFVMEVTTHVFGTDYPKETIIHADIGFLRKRVRFEDVEKQDDSFTIYLSDRYVKELGKRLYMELFGERLLDVVLNPCLRNTKIIEVLKEKIKHQSGNLLMFFDKKKLSINKQRLDQTSKNLILTKTSFLNFENEISPLFCLIVFCHTQLSQNILHSLQQMQPNYSLEMQSNFRSFCIPAVCCNGSTELFNNHFNDQAKEFLCKRWGILLSIHIASAFHNHQLLSEMIKMGVDVNLKTKEKGGWTPLILAAGNDTQEQGDYKDGESGATRRDKTVQLLLSNGADINLCKENGVSPLYIACQNGHDITVQLLLSKGADINLCTEDKASPLYIACQYGHDSIVQLLLNKGADINLCMKDKVSPLHIACQKRHDSIVQLLLDKEEDINLCTKTSASLLNIACRYGNDSIVQVLLDKKADINSWRETGASPLYIACRYGHDSTVQLLLSKGADINLCNENGTSPLYIACQNGRDSTVQLLLSKGADIYLFRKDRASPLHIACLNGHDSTLQILLGKGADINLCTKNGASPLYIACQIGHASIIQLLLSKGADINLCMEDKSSPLHEACQNGNDSIVQLLLSNGADINSCKENGVSPLFIACQNGHDSIVQLLLSNGADINLCREDGDSPLHKACQNGHDSTLKLLLDKGADIHLCNENKGSFLLIACQNGHDSIVQLLLSRGADINFCWQTGASPLYIACQKGHDSTVQLLLSNGADVNLCRENGVSPLFIACQNGHDSSVQLLQSNGADINLCIENGVSPLYIACQNGHDSTVQLLLSKGADINLCRKDGASPLHIACLNGHDSTLQILLGKGADINLCTKNGVSPLYIACQKGHASIIQLLLSKGADINLCIENGVSPLHIACQYGHDSIVQLLLGKEADINLCTKTGASPLHIACQNGHDSIVQLLLGKEADINLCTKTGASPLHIACQNGHHSTVQLLLSKGASRH